MFSKKSILLSCVCAATAISSTAWAQAGAGNEIEELVVTAEKREQSLQDIPVAVSAFTSERREVVGINSVQDLTNFTPGLAYSTNNDRAAMRGISRFTNNRSSEGGVAMYSDGFYTSSVTAFAQSSLFIDRTEALRGPQGTLYGKNAIGGALNIISKRPTDDFYGEIRGKVGNYESTTVEGAVSGPIFGTIRGRLAGSYDHVGRGIFGNLNPSGKAEGGAGGVWTVEGQLEGSLADEKIEWWVKASTTEWHNLGRGPGGRTSIQYGYRDVVSPTNGFIPRSTYGMDPNLPGNACQFCIDVDDGNYISLESNTYTANVVFHADKFDIKYITGMTYYDYRLQTDVDATSREAPFQALFPTSSAPNAPRVPKTVFPRANNQYEEEPTWFSNELNFTSNGDGPVQWLIGLYQYRETSNYTQFDARLVDDARFENPTLLGGAANAAANPLRQYAYGTSKNVSESYAIFGQADWQATEALKLTAGLRYTYDRKRSEEGSRLLCLYSVACPESFVTNRAVDVTGQGARGANTGYATVGGQRVYDESQVGDLWIDPTTGQLHRRLENNWDAVTGTLVADYTFNRDTMGYVKYSRGYKAGGFNSGASNIITFVTTDKETIDAFEAGLKTTVARRLQANASVFYYTYHDIQIPLSVFNEATQSNQTQFFNMPKARNWGFELETIWQPIDNLQILANYSYLNAKLKNACCFEDSEDPFGVVSSSASDITLPNGHVQKDLSGNSLPNATPHRISVNVNYTWEDLGPGALTASASYVWRSATYYDIFKDYWNKEKSYGQTDLRLIYASNDSKWTAIASLKNAFDQRGSAGGSGTRIAAGPLTGFVNQTISYVPPRTYSLELQRRF